MKNRINRHKTHKIHESHKNIQTLNKTVKGLKGSSEFRDRQGLEGIAEQTAHMPADSRGVLIYKRYFK
jgi:hypothetical protein